MHSPTKPLAQVRGGFVGAVSGAVSIAAHGMAGGGTPSGDGIVLLVAACVAIGAIVASVPAATDRRGALVAALAAGQLVGHLTLTVASEHTHWLSLSMPMLIAHLAAIAVSAVLVRGAERGCRAALAAVTRIVLAVLSSPPAEAPLWTSTPAHRATLSPSRLAGATAGVRSPPLPA